MHQFVVVFGLLRLASLHLLLFVILHASLVRFFESCWIVYLLSDVGAFVAAVILSLMLHLPMAGNLVGQLLTGVALVAAAHLYL